MSSTCSIYSLIIISWSSVLLDRLNTDYKIGLSYDLKRILNASLKDYNGMKYLLTKSEEKINEWVFSYLLIWFSLKLDLLKNTLINCVFKGRALNWYLCLVPAWLWTMRRSWRLIMLLLHLIPKRLSIIWMRRSCEFSPIISLWLLVWSIAWVSHRTCILRWVLLFLRYSQLHD